MVAGKVKAAMLFQKSPGTPKSDLPRRSSSSPSSNKAPPPSNSKTSAVFSRSFGVYFPRSSAQVQPRPPDVTELLRLVEELQEKESRLRIELLEHKIFKETVAIVPFLEKEVSSKNDELDRFKKRVEGLEAEMEGLRSKIKEEEEEGRRKEERIKEMEEEMEGLRPKIKEEEEEGRRKEERIKEMEAEIEELRRNGESRRIGNGTGEIDDCSSSQRFQGLIDVSSRSNLLKNLRKCSKSTDIVLNQEVQKMEVPERKDEEGETERKEISKPKGPRIPKPPPMPSTPSNSSSSSSSSASSETTATTRSKAPNLSGLPPIPLPEGGSRRAPPPPPPPPATKGLRSSATCVRRVPEVVEFYHSLMRRDSKRESGSGVTDSPSAANARNMIGEIENRSAHLLAVSPVTGLLRFFSIVSLSLLFLLVPVSLVDRDLCKITELAFKILFFLLKTSLMVQGQIKTEVETQGDFIRFLIKEVQNAAFTTIEDLVAFVKWLDDELSYLVDERAVLKHFDWPEHKADAMREAAFGYCDLKKLESEASSFRDDIRQPCSSALKKMQALLEKLEHGVYNLSGVREGAAKRYKGFHIPWEWMLETGFVSQIKLASVKLAMKYMKRVSSELEMVAGGPEEEELILQGVRFAFRVHQFAGGFDVETMRAFQELRDKACSLQSQKQNQNQQQKLFSRSMSLSC